jgi:hypothetical protein
MPTRYRWIRIIGQFGSGLFIGFGLLGSIALCLYGIVWLISVLFPPLGNASWPPSVAALVYIVLFGAPVWLAIAFAMDEAREQLAENKAATNHCAACGYSLRGIRRTSDRCPECGKVFRKWS